MFPDTDKPVRAASTPPAAQTVTAAKPAAKPGAPRAAAAAKPASKRAPAAAKPAPAAAREPAVAKPGGAGKTAEAAQPAASKKAAKAKKVKLVRDSFTMPETEYAVIALLKKRCLAAGVSAKKSEVLRAAVAGLATLSDASLVSAIRRLDVIKTGRPAKGSK
jgi:hypothetical protein